MLLFKDKHGLHGGQALAFYSDKTFKKVSAPPPAKATAVPPGATNEPAIARRPSTNTSLAVVTNSHGTATVVLTDARQQALALEFTGKEHYRNKRWVEAGTAFREADVRDPSSPWHPYNLALALSQQGRWKEAEAFLRKSVRLEPGYVPAFFVGISRMSVRAKASKSRVKCLPSPSHGTGTRQTWRQAPQRAHGGAQRISVRLPRASK